jgi:pimeloyl-ACP methyl ester carboxylesterase
MFQHKTSSVNFPSHQQAFLIVIGWLLIFLACSARAQEAMIDIDIGRGGASIPAYVMRHPQAIATLVLLPGGDAGSGKIINGKPTSGNFLSRSREYFQAEGFNVVVAYRPSDLRGLEYEYRTSKKHITEIERVVDFAIKEYGKPVWLIGTSRGSVSATASAIALGPIKINGLVLTSSVTSKKDGAISTQNIGSIQVPTLVVHHKNDACHICVPEEARLLVDDLFKAPAKKFILIDGGSNPEGEVCAARHWHGFINFEKETVQAITAWIKSSQN